MTKFIVNPVTGEYESTAYTFSDRFNLKDGGRINFGTGGDVLKAYKILSQRLNRAPSLAEIRVETGLSYNGIKNNLGNLKLSEGRTRNEAANKAAVEAAKNKRKIFDNTIKEPLSKDLEKRYQYVQGNEYKKAAREGKFLNNEQLAKKYKLTVSQIERAIAKIKQDLKLSAPKQTYEGTEKRERERNTKRKENIKKTSSPKIEEKIKESIKTIDSKALANDVDLAHRASVKANANLGADYLATSLGIDAKIVNQKYVRSTEQKLGKLYDDQKKLIKGLEPGKIPKETQKKIEKLNIKISQLSDRTKGALQGVLVDEKTLKPSIYGKDYKKVFGAGLIDDDVTVKKLTQEQIEIGKLNTKEQIKAAKSPQAKITKLRNTAQNFVNKIPGKKLRMVPGVAAAAVDYAVFAGLFGVPVDEAIIGASGWLTKKPEIAKALGTVALQYSEGKINLKEVGEKAMPILKEIGEENLPESKIKDLPVINNINENSIDIPEIDGQFMAAEGGRVNFGEGSPDPDFINMAIAADQNDNIPIEDKTFLGMRLADNPLQRFNEMIDPRAYPYYGQKIVEGASRIPEYAFRTVPALGQATGDLIKGRKSGKMDRFMEAISPTVTNKAQEAIGLTKLIEDTEKNRTEAQKGMGGQLEFLAEVPGPATPFGLLAKTPKFKRQIRGLAGSSKAAKELKTKIENKLETVDQGRRDTLLAMGVYGAMGLVKALGLDKLIPVASKAAQKTAPLVTSGGTPKYFFDFVSLIKKSGDDITEKASTLERQKVYEYEGYQLTEDLTTGEKSITTPNSNYEGVYQESEMFYKPGEDIVNEKTGKNIKSIDEYTENTAKPNRYGDMEDGYEGIDDIDDILDILGKGGKKYNLKELEEMGLNPSGLDLKNILKDPTEANLLKGEDTFKDTMNKTYYKLDKSEKAGGGIMKLAGDDSGPPPTSGPDSEGLALILKRDRKY